MVVMGSGRGFLGGGCLGRTQAIVVRIDRECERTRSIELCTEYGYRTTSCMLNEVQSGGGWGSLIGGWGEP